MTLPLIDKQDNFEIVRDQIASILATEIASQQALATAASKDPALWALNVFKERSLPWEALFDDSADDVTDETPLANVWYDSGNFPKGMGDTIERQTHEGLFNIDCYAAAVSKNDRTGSGYDPGDLRASLNVQRSIRLVRNIFMSGEYAYLGMRGVVGGRWFESINAFQPQLSDRPAIHVIAARMALRVKFNEFSPQATPADLELIATTVTRKSDGKVILEADYDVT